jgi:mannose-1-phosphate guanylyltransferase
VILAGGLGKRLRPLTDEKPKTMIEVSGVPIIGWQLSWLANHGIRDVIISIGYLKQVVRNYVRSGERFGVNVSYSEEAEPLGTGGALRTARDFIKENETFLMMYGDILTDLNPSKLMRDLKGDRDKAIGSVAAILLRSPFGIIDVINGHAKKFREKPILKDYLMNAGIYCLSSRIFQLLPEKGSFESTTLPKLAHQRKLLVTIYGESVRWRSIDSHKDIEEAELEFASLIPKSRGI